MTQGSTRQETPEATDGAISDEGRSDRRWLPWVRRAVAVGLVAGAVVAAVGKRHQLAQASHLLSHLHWTWLGVAIAVQAASMIVFARLQRWLLKAGGVDIGLGPMVEITLAGNAMSTSLPGGVAWAAGWAFGQLRRRGADRVLAGWVILVAGALSSFALFLVVAGGIELAGSRGPMAKLRWGALVLAGMPVVAAMASVAIHRSSRVRGRANQAWAWLRTTIPKGQTMASAVERLAERARTVRPSPLSWLEAFALALVNWVDDCACMVACILALGAQVPWRGVLVAYGFTQIAASLPVTPGGLGVVEASMATLLVAYGMRADQAFATVVLYRVVSFWGLVPVGWGTWGYLELSRRRGRRGDRPHPWILGQHALGDHLLHHRGHGPAPPALSLHDHAQATTGFGVLSVGEVTGTPSQCRLGADEGGCSCRSEPDGSSWARSRH